MLSKEDAKARMRDVGLRATAPRVAVLRLLADAKRPLSHTELLARLGDRPDWDQATIYRNLKRFAQVGLTRVASEAGGLTRYELAQGKGVLQHVHPHFVCSECGTVSCLPEIALPQTDLEWSAAVGEAAVQFVGRCPGCRVAAPA